LSAGYWGSSFCSFTDSTDDYLVTLRMGVYCKLFSPVPQ
jgi:hypothetical protein